LLDPTTQEVLKLCSASGVGRCETVTVEDGSFHLRVHAQRLESLVLKADGGQDQETGVDFGGLTLRAPLALFAGREEQIILSPATSLLTARLRYPGPDLGTAFDEIRRDLGLDAAADLGTRPSSDPVLLHRTLLLTAIALELERGGEADPFAHIGDRTSELLLFSPEGVEAGALAALGINDAAVIARLLALDRALTAADDLPAAFRRTGILHGLEEIAERMLQDDPAFEPLHPQFRQNLATLADLVVQAAGPTVIPFGGVAQQRIARYLFFTYDLTQWPSLAGDPATFAPLLLHPETGQPLSADPRIAELARLRSLYSVSVPLLAYEHPRDDNQSRLFYFSNSDLSPFYFAELVAGEILDDLFSDQVMLAIAKGKGESGLLTEAEAIVATQVFQAEKRGAGYWQLGATLIDYGRSAQALPALVKAEEFYRKVVEAKGYASISQADVRNLLDVALGLRRAGDLAASQRSIDYLAALAPYFNTTALYGSVLTGTWKLADEYLARGEPALAAPLVDFMHTFASQTPPNVVGSNYSYKAKVFYLVETAKRFADLGQLTRVNEIYGQVQAIRANDGFKNLTAGETWLYMVDFVELLYRCGHSETAFALAGEIPAINAVKAFKLVATYEALNNGLAPALSIIETHLPLRADKIEALTYFANNLQAEFVALALINRWQEGGAPAWYPEAARQALETALREIALLTPATDAERYQQLLQRGYIKVAGLFRLAGEFGRAEELLAGEAQAALATISILKPRVDALVDLALEYHRLDLALRAAGKPGVGGAEALLLQAAEEIRLTVAATVRPASPATAATLYRDFANLYEKVIAALLDAGRRSTVIALTPLLTESAGAIFDSAALYAGNDHDTWAGREVDLLLRAAEFLTLVGDRVGAATVLAETEKVARQIWTEAVRIEKFTHESKRNIIGGYAAAGYFEPALALARSLPYTADRHRGLQTIAITYAGRDDFPATEVARIDTDGDGRPDFFHPLATAEQIAASGLVLDDDCDGDGIPDLLDRRPWHRDLPGVLIQ
ncbi:MAG: hypothetical protein IH614_13230, partial [Desulfuromonadales bacterium]|nr:hypothetical protein [Desulfuromonadales bacterium]